MEVTELRDNTSEPSRTVARRRVVRLVKKSPNFWLHGSRAQLTRLLHCCTRRSSRVNHQTVAACTERRCLSHYWHQTRGPYHSSSDALTCLLMHPVHTNRRRAYMAVGRDCRTHCNNFVAVWPPVCQLPPVLEASVENQGRERAFSHAGPAAWNSLPDYFQSESNTKHFKKLLKTFLLHASSFWLFIVCRNMKCSLVYFVGGQ